jgi:hypothetical protein
MEVKLNAKEVAVVVGATVMNVVIACKAIKKAHMAEKEAEHQKFMRDAYEADNCIKDILIKRLLKENEDLKSGRKGKES